MAYMPEKVLLSKTDVLRSLLLSDLYFFTRYFFKQTSGKTFIRGNEGADHFQVLSDTLEKVYTGEITRLIINIPPRHGKTELAVINFVAKGLMINPAATFIHTSYSDSLALDNSEKIKELIESEAYQAICPIKVKRDSDSKAKWYTTAGGGMYATSSGGQITGFGAGIAGHEGFSGAIIIDDPLKPDDAGSEPLRERINERFDGTIRSRVNNPNTPIIVIMQRLHESDLCGKLLKEGGWHHLNMPAMSPDGQYLWDYRGDVVEDAKKIPHVFLTQYQQTPVRKQAGARAFWGYNEEIHTTLEPYSPDPNQHVDITFDFNKNPTTILVGQHNRRTGTFHLFDYITADPDTAHGLSPLEAACWKFYRDYMQTGKVKQSLIRVGGDASGKQGDADRAKNRDRYDTICRILKINRNRQVFVRGANMGHETSLNRCNYAMRQLGSRIQFHTNGPLFHVAQEMTMAYTDGKGTLNDYKEKNKDNPTSHAMDCIRYKFTDIWFAEKQDKWQQLIDYFAKIKTA